MYELFLSQTKSVFVLLINWTDRDFLDMLISMSLLHVLFKYADRDFLKKTYSSIVWTINVNKKLKLIFRILDVY